MLRQVGHGEGADTDVLLGSEQGLMTRIALDNTSLHKSRAGQGMRLMQLKAGQTASRLSPHTGHCCWVSVIFTALLKRHLGRLGEQVY